MVMALLKEEIIEFSFADRSIVDGANALCVRG